jgi:transmembrane sensor
MEPSKQAEERAAQWLAQRDSGNWSPADQAALDQWLDESTGHVVAFVRLQTAWTRADRLQALGAGFPAGKIPTPEEFNRSPFFDEPAHAPTPLPLSTDDATLVPSARERRGAGNEVLRRALAATFLLALTSATAWHFWPTGPDYKTPVGGTASVPMADGSKVTLNTDSAIRVTVTEKERQVQLDHGEAFFEVAKDPKRPFVVSAGKNRVIAIGTKFSVRLIANDIRVFVTEGRVRIDDDSSLVVAGSIASTDGDGILVQQKPLPEVEESLSWRTGYLIFHETTLADAATEFNRYNLRKIVIEDPSVGSIRLSGKFHTTDFEAFVRLLEGGFPIHVKNTPEQIVLTSSAAM